PRVRDPGPAGSTRRVRIRGQPAVAGLDGRSGRPRRRGAISPGGERGAWALSVARVRPADDFARAIPGDGTGRSANPRRPKGVGPRSARPGAVARPDVRTRVAQATRTAAHQTGCGVRGPA